MDIHEAQKLGELADEQIKRAKEYAEARKEAGEAKADLDVLLAANFKDIRSRKRNVGYETALIMLIEDNKIAEGLYYKMLQYKYKYKGLEKIIEALQSKISLAQSQMRYIHRGENYGA